MIRALDTDELLRQNAAGRRDENVLREAQEMIEILRDAGVVQKSYDLARPFGSKKIIERPTMQQALATTKFKLNNA